MSTFNINHILQFNQTDGHPDSKIVGIDSYVLNANDCLTREWKSYTLVPVNPDQRHGAYKRWYTVDLPELGLSFVQIVEKKDLPLNLIEDLKLSGKALVTTTGDGELGTGESKLWTYWDKNIEPHQMYAKEAFADGTTLYFKTNSLKSPVNIML